MAASEEEVVEKVNDEKARERERALLVVEEEEGEDDFAETIDGGLELEKRVVGWRGRRSAGGGAYHRIITIFVMLVVGYLHIRIIKPIKFDTKDGTTSFRKR